MQRWYICTKCGDKVKEGQGILRWDATCEKCGGSFEYLADFKREQKELKERIEELEKNELTKEKK